MSETIRYDVWGFANSQQRDKPDKQIGKFLGPVTSFQQVLEMQMSSVFIYLAYWNPSTEKWVSYPEMAASFGQEPWASMRK